MSDARKIAPFVRHETLPEAPPPTAKSGTLGWLRQNLFSSVTNTIMSLIAL